MVLESQKAGNNAKQQKAGDNSRQQQAGENSNLYQIDNHYHYPQTNLGTLLKQLELDLKSENRTEQIIEDLNFLLHKKTATELVGLKEKLQSGERIDLLEDAEMLKERIAIKIARHEHIESAKKVYLYLLEEVLTTFKYTILPLIKSGSSNIEIDRSIKENIIDRVCKDLNPNSLNLYQRDIEGIMYFLIGNCHIKWG